MQKKSLFLHFQTFNIYKYMKSEKLYSEIKVTQKTAIELGLTKDEWGKILEILGRTPTYTELGMYSVLWSEHCSYKNSIKLLKTLPRSSKKLLVEAGEENAGIVDIGGGYGIAFKIESHNHPSAIDPFEAASTGVGGALRDIFTMGARPIATLNSLRLGELDNDRTKFLLEKIAAGMAHYGNNVEVPSVAGEIYFEECYQDNPLVNAMTVGIVDVNKIATAAATGVGNSVIIIGLPTGRDGVQGASFASKEFDDKDKEKALPVIPAGDPIAGKGLLEATLELIDAGIVVSIQDMGAAGFSCATTEMSAKKGVGMKIDLDKVPLREEDMSAYEIMLSESQERMLAVIKKGEEDACHNICKKWGINSVQVGEITDDGVLRIWRNGKYVAELNPVSLVLGGGAPQYDREDEIPEYILHTLEADLSEYYQVPATEEMFIKLLSSPNIASKKCIYEQFDAGEENNIVSIKGDAGVLKLKELPGKGIALSVDCNSKYCYLEPYSGTISAVCEAARNVACTGATPIAITNNLNFGDPYDEGIYWQFKHAIIGMEEACRRMDLPVTGGNVSFHNESNGEPIYPTPVIGMLGVIDDISKVMSADYKNVGDLIYVLGTNEFDIGGSEYLKVIHNEVIGRPPATCIPDEQRLISTLLELIDKQVINAAHDISEGGLAITLAEMSIFSGSLGNKITLDAAAGGNMCGSIFSETQSRVVVTINPKNVNELLNICEEHYLDCENIGEVIADKFIIEEVCDMEVQKIIDIYENAIPNKLNS